MASQSQIEFFDNLTEKRAFPADADLAKLREQFASLTQKNASKWIENALKLPERAAGDEPAMVPPPF